MTRAHPVRHLLGAATAILIFLAPGILWSQSSTANASSANEWAAANEVPAGRAVDDLPDKPVPAVQAQTADQNKNEKDTKKENEKSTEGEQTKRMLWVVPNFGAVNADTQLPPMSTREKFSLAAKDSVTDYSSYTWAGILAGQAYLLNADPEFGRGGAAYGRYYWRTFVDGVSGTFFTEAIVPSIRHEDPRYYTLGKGGFFKRSGYAISRAFITKMDNGDTGFNCSEVCGNALTAGLSNAYYPAEERGISQTAYNFGEQMESAVLNHIFQEFWPDIRKKVLHQKD
jgi:hypothetical protein